MLQRFAFDTAAIGCVADDDFGKIRLAGHGTMGGEFLRGKGDFIVALRRALKGLEHIVIWRGDLWKRAAPK